MLPLSKEPQAIDHPNHSWIVWLILLSYFLIWSIANSPAVSHAWWYLDDFYQAENISSSVQRGLEHGRPIEGVWFLTYYLDSPPGHTTQNVILRLIQGGFHVLASFSAAYLIWRQSQRWTAFVAVFPFLLWPFNGEAVLWRAAGAYPLAAFISILAIIFIHHLGRKQERYRVAGTLLLAIAGLTNQVAAMAGATLWLLIASLQLLKDERVETIVKRWWKDIYCLGLGYLGAGVVSFVLARAYDTATVRSSTATSVSEKLDYLRELNKLFLTFPLLYSNWLARFHLVIVVIAGLMALYFMLRKDFSFRKASLLILFLLSPFVIPYAPLMIVAENWPSFRVLYIAPFLLTFAWLVMDETSPNGRWSNIILLLLILPVVVGYIRLTWTNSAEYVMVFEQDLQVVNKVEALASGWRTDRIYVASYPEFTTPNWNPYGVKLMYKDSKLSAFLIDYAWGSFLRLFSHLKPTYEDGLKQECLSFCEKVIVTSPFTVEFFSNQQAICMCTK